MSLRRFRNRYAIVLAVGLTLVIGALALWAPEVKSLPAAGAHSYHYTDASLTVLQGEEWIDCCGEPHCWGTHSFYAVRRADDPCLPCGGQEF